MPASCLGSACRVKSWVWVHVFLWFERICLGNLAGECLVGECEGWVPVHVCVCVNISMCVGKSITYMCVNMRVREYEH